MTVRVRVGVELSLLAGLTAVFLVSIPERPSHVDLGLALLGFGAVLATAKDTRERIWGSPATPPEARRRHSWRHGLIGTAAVTAACAVVGSVARGPDWLLRPSLGIALALFIPWAFVQQALLQFYLLGRLRALLPQAPPVALAGMNGLLFGVVHLPDLDIAIAGGAAGAVWSWYYLRDRCLVPIAVSHSVVGTAYFTWVRGDDLARDWLGLLA